MFETFSLSLRQLFSELEEECEIISSQVETIEKYFNQCQDIPRLRRPPTSHRPQSGCSKSRRNVLLKDCPMMLIRDCFDLFLILI